MPFYGLGCFIIRALKTAFFTTEKASFFLLKLEEDKYIIPDRYTDNNFDLISTLLQKVNTNSPDIIEFKKRENIVIDPGFSNPAKKFGKL